MRLARHLAFWAAYCLYFYLQSISPDCIRELDPKDVFSFAFTSLYCFLPACILCVYVSLEILYPYFLRKKKYFRLFLSFFPLFGICVGMNYFFSVLFLKISCHCNVDDIIFLRKFTLGYLNSQNAIIAGALALGIKLTRNWYLQKEENLRLAVEKARTSLNLEKVKIHPDFLLLSLDNIIDHIKTGSPEAADTIVDLSDRLSRWLYEEEDLV
jgi:hypothetical protein